MQAGPYRKTSAVSTKANHMFFQACRSPFGASASALALLLLVGCTPERVNTDPILISLVDRFGASEIQHLPEEADLAGLSDKAFGRPYGALLNDRSMAVTERTRAIRLDYLAEFERIDRAEGRFEYLSKMTALSTLTLTLREIKDYKPAPATFTPNQAPSLMCSSIFSAR